MEEAPTLRLEILKGPRAGEALEFKPGKKVGIGRLVRGNAVQIKDDGISSKHLCIGFDSRKWLITDLDSSNGTILNGAAVDPLVPTVLRDGDVVKIGACTSITVRFEARVELVSVVGESNVRRNPRRRAAATAGKHVVAENVESVGVKMVRVKEGDAGSDLDEKKKKKKKLEGGGDDGESVAEKRGGLRGASKRNNAKKVDDKRPELEVVDDSDVKLENVDEVAETGRRPKKMNVEKGVAEGVESVLTDEEGLKAGSQAVKWSRGGRGAGKGRALKENNCEHESAVAGVKVTDVRNQVVAGGALDKKTMEYEVAMVDGKCDKPLQSVTLEDGIKKRTRGGRRKAQVARNEVIKETHEDKDIVNSGSEMHGNLVDIKKEKFSLCHSIVPESLSVNSCGSVFENENTLDGQPLEAVENGVSQKVKHETVLDSSVSVISENGENAMRLGSHEPDEAAGVHIAVVENNVMSKSHKKEIMDSENEKDENFKNFKKEKFSTCSSIHEKIPEMLRINSSELEFGNERNSEGDELEAKDDGISEKDGGKTGLETHEPLKVVGNAESISSGRKTGQGFPAETSRYGGRSGRGDEVKLVEMTLGEWFDYLEVYLTKQIHNATEEMIASMIEKSKQFEEYMSQPQKEKGNILASYCT